MEVRRIQASLGAYRAITLLNDSISITVIPELGGRIVSLRNLPSGREWCWHPNTELALHPNQYGDSFGDSPHAGIDECFPTIEACFYENRAYPCHGEIWTESWTVNQEDATSIDLEIRPKQFPATLRRSISLDASTARLRYRLESHSSKDENYLWALHPFFRLVDGDILTLPDSVSELSVGASAGIPGAPARVPWPSPLPGFDLDRFTLGDNRAARIKAFTPVLSEGKCGIRNAHSNDELEISWDTNQNPFLGIWITRGGYRGIQQVAALEPTNTPHDSLMEASKNIFTLLPAGQHREWDIRLSLS